MWNYYRNNYITKLLAFCLSHNSSNRLNNINLRVSA